ncbi:MAG TPA: hypothetical protein PK228_12140 [Saprospiraceae bacterium]|nr:hypothetical protein [Saprospiraceae bacterium]
MQTFGSNQHANCRLTVFLCLLACLPAAAQTVENVDSSFDASKQLMYIYYDLKGLNYKKEIKITPYIESGDGTLTALQSISGDFGWVNKGGKNKVVIWDPFKDGITGLDSVHIKIISSEVRDAAIPRFKGLLLHGSNSAPLGLKYMQLGRVGFYAGFRVGKWPPSYTYPVTNMGEMEYKEFGVYEIGTEKRLASYAITAGPTFQVARNIYVYAGAGYGLEQLFWEYQAYDLNKTPLDTEWALNEDIDSKGVAADAGIIMRFGRVLVDVGGGTIQFNSYQITGGIGLVLGKPQKL